jgi:hypothetical protein
LCPVYLISIPFRVDFLDNLTSDYRITLARVRMEAKQTPAESFQFRSNTELLGSSSRDTCHEIPAVEGAGIIN